MATVAEQTKKTITANLRYYGVRRSEIDIVVNETSNEFEDLMTVIAFYYKGTKRYAGLSWFYHDESGTVIA